MHDRPQWRAITEVLDAHRDALVAVPGVLGTAIGLCDGVPCIRVFVEDASALPRLPATLEGWLVRPEVTGRYDARSGLP